MGSSRTWGVLGVMAALAVSSAGAPDDKVAQTFQTLFGFRIAQAKNTAGRKDDDALAEEMLAAARRMASEPALAAMICESVYELSLAIPEGSAAAAGAMEFLAEVAPGRKGECLQKMLALQQRAFRTSRGLERIELGEAIIDTLLGLADSAIDAGQLAEAASYCRQAMATGGLIKSQRQPEAQGKLAYALSRGRVASQITMLQSAVERNPKDMIRRGYLIATLLLEMDNPVDAAKYVVEGVDKGLAEHVPLAARDPETLAEADCLKLADWYRSLVGKASPDAQVHAQRRAAGYYGRFLEKHPQKDLDRTKAEAAMKLAREFIAKSNAPAAMRHKEYPVWPAILTFARLRKRLPAADQVKMTQVKLTEYNGGKEVAIQHQVDRKTGKIVSVTVSGLTEALSIEPLFGLELASLHVAECPNLMGDLQALKDMPLQTLTLMNCGRLEGLHGIEAAPLTRLVLTGGRSLAGDLNVLRGMPLTFLTLQQCESLESLAGIENAPLTTFRATGCTKLRDLSPLKGKQLQTLDLTGCQGLEKLAGLDAMPLKQLLLRGCKKIGPDLSALAGMKLESLDLTGCEALETLTGIEGAPLERLTIGRCAKLRSIKALSDLKLTSLVLAGVPALESLDGLQGMPLTSLTVGNALSLADLKPLAETQQLTSLTIADGAKLQSLDGILNLPLKSVRFSKCGKLTDAELRRLTQIPTLVQVATGDEVLDEMIRQALGKAKDKGPPRR